MLPTDPGLRLAVGVSGSGKSHGIRNEVLAAVRAGVPVVVIDLVYEWAGKRAIPLPADVAALASQIDRAKPAYASAELRPMIDRAVARGKRLVIVNPGEEIVEDAIIGCGWARDARGVAGIAIPEANRIAPAEEKRLPREIDDVVTRWRHYEVAAWFDTQRLAMINATLREQAAGCEVRVYAILGPRDLAVVREWGGAELEDAVRDCGRRFALGEKGWHVPIGIGHHPPFTPQRCGADGARDVARRDEPEPARRRATRTRKRR